MLLLRHVLLTNKSILIYLLTLFPLLPGISFAAALTQGVLGTWYLTQFQSSSDSQPVQRPEKPRDFSLRLEADGRAYLKLGCNRAMGQWQSEPAPSGASGRFSFGPLAGTRALCAPPRLDELVSSQAAYIRSFVLEGNRLHLSLMADGGIFTWQRHSASLGAPFAYESPEQGGPRNWMVSAAVTGLNLRASPSVRAERLTTYPGGTPLDNLGCETIAARIWCDVQQLGGGPRGYVAAEYLLPALSPNGEAIFGEDDSALRAGEGDFDARAQVRCRESATAAANYCDAAVSRSGGGYATLIVTRPSGSERVFYFRMGRLIGVNVSEADYPGELKQHRVDDAYEVKLGAERYTLPDALIIGG